MRKAVMYRMRNNTDKKAFWVRLICGLLVFLMLASAAYYAVMAIVIAVSANDTSLADYAIDADAIANIYVSCGIYYGSTAQNTAAVTTGRGFVIGESEITSKIRKFTPYISFDGVTSLAASPLTFLSLQNGKYLPCDSSSATVLPYRIEISASSGDVWELSNEIETLVASAKDMFCVKGLSNGKKVLRYGSFADASSASTAAGEFEALLSGLSTINVNISIPTGTGICLYNSTNGEILFEYDSNTTSKMPAVFPLKAKDGSIGWTKLANGFSYYDAICFSRSNELINTINLVELNTYIEGVLPSEIYASWPIELQKAFSIIVRSYTVASLGGRHFSSYNFELCSTADCQAYKGRSLVTDKVIQAVRETEYNVMSTNGSSISSAYYSAVNGGESIGTVHAWGGSNPAHIVSQKTPWEKYTTYTSNRGFWFAEFTPEQLTLQLRSEGYTNVTKPITNINVNSRAGETNYVYSTTYTDSAGNTQTITRTSRNYGALGLRSANYNIGFGSVDYYLDTVISVDIKRITNQSSNPLISAFNVITSGGIFSTNSASANVLTNDGVFALPQNTLHALTENGTVTLQQVKFSASEPDADGYYTAINVYGDTVITTKLKREHHTYTASAAGNIVVAGKGWGHGIGLSQYGAKDLADFGAEYDQIIRAYYSNTEVISIRELRGLE